MKSLLNYLSESNNRTLKLPDVLYHATSSHLLSSIKKYGLGGKMPKRTWWDYDSTEYKIENKEYFSQQMNMLLHHS